MPSPLDQIRTFTALGNRILANEGVLDAFGHVSMRHPTNPTRYFLSRSRAPELVEPADILEYDLDSNPVKKTDQRLYAERVIHGEIYKARPDVMAVVHHHAPAVMPFCISGVELQPVMHLGAVIGPKVPMWDQYDDFGDTNLLLVKPEEGASLARSLGDAPLVLMKGHGATVVGSSIQELVFRAIYSCRNAEYQFMAKVLGNVSPLRPGEVEKSSQINAMPTANFRTWEYWSVRLDKAGGGLPRAGKKRVGTSAKRASVAPTKSRKAKGRAR
ncbi:MAG: class II aldolase/adducin family protein [Pseudorhodoplanes sp.]|uniref:class II aldolase/adducin family protein n=1 Tax=Pseudorhodoplanes sp. TaxID=1934341 RepID=UPI003D0A5F21